MSIKQKKVKRNREKSEEIALKITEIFNLIKSLSQEDIDYLSDTAKVISEESSKLQAIGGLLVDYDKAEAKQKLGRQAQSRIKGLIMIWNALKETPDIQMNYSKKLMNKNRVDGMFGL